MTTSHHPGHVRRTGLLLIVLLLFALPKIVCASIVVLGLTPGKIIVAAESRAGQHGQYTDAECKIAVLDQHTAYFAVNITRFPSELLGDGKGWSAMTTAINAKRTAGKSLDALATAWATIMTRDLERSLRLKPDLTLGAIKDDGIAVNGVFARLNGTQVPSALQVTITRDGKRFVPTTHPVTDALTAYGNTEAWRWLQTHLRTARVEPGNPDALRQLVADVIGAHVTPAIGGPVDLLVLEAGKPAHWIERKNNCRAQ